MITYFIITGVLTIIISITVFFTMGIGKVNLKWMIWFLLTGWIQIPIGIIFTILIAMGVLDAQIVMDEVTKLGIQIIEFRDKIFNKIKSIFKK